MATYFARKTGNVNATDVWATTPTGVAGDFFPSFTSGDILISNSFTITINVSVNLGSTGEVRNDTTGGATAGGSFSLNNNITLTANIIAGGASSCVFVSGNNSATIIGNITGGTSVNRRGLEHNSSGTVSITGSISGSSGGGADGVYHTSGLLNITGNITGGFSSSDSRGVRCLSSAGVVTIVGSITGGSTTSCHGLELQVSNTCNIVGTITGGTSCVGVRNTSSGTITIVGTSIGGNSQGSENVSNGTITLTRAKGGPLSTSNAGISNTSSGIVNIEEIEYGDLGASPTSGPIRLTDKTSNVCLVYRPSLSKKTLLDLNSTSLLPSSSNVRSGIIYNAGQNTGSMNVPPAASVKVGVPVDNTVGTAALSPEDIWNVLTTNINTSGSIGERLKNCATIASVGQQLSDSLTIK